MADRGATVKKANPYLNFDGDTEEAFDFYKSVFGGEFAALLRFRDFDENPMGVPDDELDKIAHIALPLGSTMLMGTDVLRSQSASFTVGTNSYLHLEVDSASEARRAFGALSAGGRVEMPLGEAQWSELYGILVDRFGVQWIVDYTGKKESTQRHSG